MNKETIKISREEADSLSIPVLRKMFGIIETGEYSIERLTDYAYRCYTKMNLFIYILMFIPIHIFEMLLDKSEKSKFQRLKDTHPKIYDYIMRPTEKGGLNYKEIINWLNEHGNLNIRY